MRSIFNTRLKVKDLLNIDYPRIKRSRELDVLFVEKHLIKETVPKVLRWIRKLFNAASFHNLFVFKTDKYKILIETDDKFSKESFDNSKVRVFCSCHDFKYRAAYNLTMNDNLFQNPATKVHLGPALNTPPTKITPTPVCKHVYNAMHLLRVSYDTYIRDNKGNIK